MKLINKTQVHKQGGATISISRSGLITLSIVAAEIMGIKPGDEICLFQDAESPTDWYVRKEDNGLKLRQSNELKPLQTNSKMLTGDIIDSLPGCATDVRRTYSMMVSNSPIEDGYHAIITRKFV